MSLDQEEHHHLHPHTIVNTETQGRGNAFNILDRGLLSCNIFLAYKQCVESRIVLVYGGSKEWLGHLKKKAIHQLKVLHRDTIHKSVMIAAVIESDNVYKLCQMMTIWLWKTPLDFAYFMICFI
eukprot:922133_1